jgi:ABC-2 type transport system permease protein
MSTDAVATRVAPSAFGDDLRRFVSLTVALAKTDFKLRYFGSILGYVWSLVRPILFFLTLYLVFAVLFNLNARNVNHKYPVIHNYPVYLLTAVMLWTFFVETTVGCVQCLLARESLLRKVRFPRLVIPLSVALTAMFNLAINSIVVVGFALASNVRPTLTWLELPVLVAGLATLAVGIGMLLSVLYVRFRDMQPIWDVATQVLFYACPIIYTATQFASKFPGQVRYTMINPIATILTQMGHAFVDPSFPGASWWIGGATRLVIPLAIIAAVFVVGLWFFNREAPRIAENL